MRLTEKYRPIRFDQIVGQDENIKDLQTILKRYKKSQEAPPAFLFLGPPGVGKTTAAQCFAQELYGDQWIRRYTELNASDSRRIADVRGIIKRLSKVKGSRVLFLDEFDNMTPDAQQALRRIMEQTNSTIFILSGNQKKDIIEPIISRCIPFTFKRLDDSVILQQILRVCVGEGIKVVPQYRDALTILVKDAHGDLRKAINNLEKIIDEKKELSVANVIALREIDLATAALNDALSGNFDKAREMIEDAFIASEYNTTKMLDALYQAIGSLEEKYNPINIRLYEKLAEVDYALKIGGNPVFQFVGFIAFAWVLPHIPDKCPAIETR